MRIDNRKVNGQITIDPEDIINAWTILVAGQTAEWISGIDKTKQPIALSASVAGTYIKTALDAFNPVQFAIMTVGTSGDHKVLPMPAYTYDTPVTKLSIDIGAIMVGHTLEIALPTGAITVKENK